MRGAPQSGFSRLILRISWRTTSGMLGRPGCACRTSQEQNHRKPVLCQAIAVSGWTLTRLASPVAPGLGQPGPEDSISGVNLGRFA